MALSLLEKVRTARLIQRCQTANSIQTYINGTIQTRTGNFRQLLTPLVLRQLSTTDSANSSTRSKESEAAKETLRSMYATDWKDDNYPQWQQFLEMSSKRHYYHNRETGKVSWAPPSKPELDIFQKERDDEITLRSVKEHAKNAGLLRRSAACVLDLGFSFGAGCVFGLCVYIDLESAAAAIPAIGFSSWIAFLARDMVIENGSRSLGKKFMKLEIVRVDGQLPSRWNCFFRQVYLPVYAASGLLMPYIFFLAAADVACIIFTPYNMRIGDFIGQTRVIYELPDRAERLQEMKERDAAEDLKD